MSGKESGLSGWTKDMPCTIWGLAVTGLFQKTLTPKYRPDAIAAFISNSYRSVLFFTGYQLEGILYINGTTISIQWGGADRAGGLQGYGRNNRLWPVELNACQRRT